MMLLGLALRYSGEQSGPVSSITALAHTCADRVVSPLQRSLPERVAGRVRLNGRMAIASAWTAFESR